MAAKISVDSIDLITYNGARLPVWIGALPTRSFTDLDGDFVGGGRISSVDKDWITKVAVTSNGNGSYSSAPFTGVTALSATRWSGVDQGVKWNFYLLDSRLNVLKTLYQNIVITDSVSVTSISDAETLSTSRYYPKTTSLVSNDDLNLLLAGLALAPDATTIVKGKVTLSEVGTNIAVATNDSRVVDNLANYNDDLQQAIDDIGATETVLVISRPATTSGDKTFPKNIHLDFQGLGLLTIDGVVTVTINSMADPGNRKTFNLVSGGEVRFGKGAVEKMNTYWLTGASGNMASAINQYLETVTTNGGGIIYIPEGLRTIGADDVNPLPTNTRIEGAGASHDVASGTTLRSTKDGNIFTIGSDVFNISFANLTLDGDIFDCNGVNVENTGSASNQLMSFENVFFYNGTTGFRHQPTAGTPQLAQVNFSNCRFLANSHSSVRTNSVNSAFQFNTCNFYVPDNGYGCYFEGVGAVTMINNEFAGLPAGAACSGGSPATSMAECAIYFNAAHGNVLLIGHQDEAFRFSIINDASDVSGIITIIGSNVQVLN